jgi:hypothetical protein
MRCTTRRYPTDCSFLANTAESIFRVQGSRAQDHHEPKQYLSFLPDTHLRSLAEVDFSVLDFNIVELPDETEPGVHFQALTFRRLQGVRPPRTT